MAGDTTQTAPEPHEAQPREERDRIALFARCERALSGHGRLSMRDELAALAAEAGAEEERDVYGAGKLIEDFEHEIAGMLGKPAAVFMPSGTMAQQIALRLWSERRGSATVAFHPTCHLDLHEERAYHALHGLRARLVGDARALITRADLSAIHEPVAALLLELPQREIGGLLPPWEELAAQAEWARAHGVALHMDGARLWESAPFYERSYAEVAALFDSMYVSFYKGIGGIAGAALAGPADFIAEARVWRTRHGGTLRSLYPYVLAARAGLRHRLARFPHYHERALALARTLSAIPGVLLKPNPPHTHMMHVYLRGAPDQLVAASETIARDESVALFRQLWPTDLPEYCRFELTVGDAADALSDDEIAGYFRRVLALAS